MVSFYTFEHVPRKEHSEIFKNVFDWIKPGGYFLFSMEAAEVNDHMGKWLDVPMFFSSYPPDITKKIVKESGFEIIESAIENQFEGKTEIPYLWLLAQKPETTSF